MKSIRIFFAFLMTAMSVLQVNAQQSPPMIKPTNIDQLEWRLDELDGLSPEKLKVNVTKSGNGEKAELILKVKDKDSNQLLLDVDFSKLAMPADAEYEALVKKAMTSTAMCGSIPSVSIAQIGSTRDYVVQANYSYSYLGSEITVPTGFVFDRASIPRSLWLMISPDDLGNVAPLLHDYVYRHGGKLPKSSVNPHRAFSRGETDLLFKEIMTKCGVEPWRIEAAFLAVRTVSGFAWKD